MIYLDSAATTKISPEVLDAMMPFLCEQYGNAGSIYESGRYAAAAIQAARAQTAKLFGCDPRQVVFTSCGSEGNSMVFRGLRNKLLESGKKHLVLSATEHDSVIKAAEALIKHGFYLTYVKPDSDGRITANAVMSAIQEDTGLVSVMFANNETGVVNDVKNIGELCREHSILFHSDCVQAAGQYAIDVDENCIDFAVISGHKIHAPKGIGAIYMREQVLEPIISGGSNQERGLRGGTENVASIVGLGVACEKACDEMADNMFLTSSLKQSFVSALLSELPCDSLKDNGISCNGRTHIAPGKVLSLRIDGVFGETLVLMMDAMGVCISAGSACRSHEASPSHVLIAQGLTDNEARSSVRLSFSKYNTEEEVVKAATIMANCIVTLRNSMEKMVLENGGKE